MKYPIIKSIVASTAVALVAFGAQASRVPGNMLSGSVTGVTGNQITVNGKNYSVQVQSPALRELQLVQVGQKVDLVLNGPANSAATQVIAIHVHAAGQ